MMMTSTIHITWAQYYTVQSKRWNMWLIKLLELFINWQGQQQLWTKSSNNKCFTEFWFQWVVPFCQAAFHMKIGEKIDICLHTLKKFVFISWRNLLWFVICLPCRPALHPKSDDFNQTAPIANFWRNHFQSKFCSFLNFPFAILMSRERDSVDWEKYPLGLCTSHDPGVGRGLGPKGKGKFTSGVF